MFQVSLDVFIELILVKSIPSFYQHLSWKTKHCGKLISYPCIQKCYKLMVQDFYAVLSKMKHTVFTWYCLVLWGISALLIDNGEIIWLLQCVWVTLKDLGEIM